MGRPRAGVLVVPLVALAAALAGCSSTHPAARATSTTSSTPSSTTSSSVAPSTSTTAGGPAHCPASQLTVSFAGTEGAAGTFEVTFALRNAGTTTCTMLGYPGAQLYDAGGAALPTTVVRGGSYSFTDFSPSAVSLVPGASAWFNLGYSDVPTGTSTCPTAASMWVTPPGAVDHAVVTHQFVACGGKLTVSPVFGQGSPETQTTAPPQP